MSQQVKVYRELIFADTGAKATLGTSTVPLVLTADGTPNLTLYSTCASTSGTANTAIIDQTQTGASATIVEVLKVNLDSEVRTGSWANAIVGRINYGDAGDSAGGMAAAICGEINLPGKACAAIGGGYYVFDAELNANTSFTANTAIARAIAFYNAGLWGGAKAQIDSYGYFLRTDGMTAGATKLLSLTSQTLKCAIEGAARYLPLSQMEDGLGLGVTGTHMVLTTAATKAIRIYTTTSIATATQISSVEINQYRTADNSANGRDWALKVNLSSTHKYPSGANAIYGSMTFVAAGVHGRGAALQGEIILPNAQIVRGTISCLTLEMSQGASTNSGSSGPVSFISCVAAGTLTDLDARGYLFEITGVSEGNDKLCDNGGTPAAADGGIRCLINGSVRYLLYANDAEN